MFLNGPINSLGYGVAFTELCKAMLPDDTIGIVPIGVDHSILTTQLKQGIVASQTLSMSDPAIRMWHQHDMLSFPGRGPRIGFPIFELDAFSSLEKHHLESLDAIFTTSKWGKDVLSHYFDKPIYVVPLGVDNTIFKPMEQRSDGVFRFCNIGKWEIRKGHDILIEAFGRAFSNNSNVELHLLCENPFLSAQQTKEWEDFAHSYTNIYIHSRLLTHYDVAKWIADKDCGVFPTRAEGWNLEALECLSCGLQLIHTNYSAPTEYIKTRNCVCIEPKSMVNAYDGIWFDGKVGKWADINIDDLIDCMKEVVKIGPKRNDSGIETARQFSWENSANVLRQSVSNFL